MNQLTVMSTTRGERRLFSISDYCAHMRVMQNIDTKSLKYCC